jgi:bacterioferritin-associated ferredoxin
VLTLNDNGLTLDNLMIDRCYCIQRTFKDLIEIAQRDNLDIPELVEQEGCGERCGWCVAYLKKAMLTGQTGFMELLDREEISPVLFNRRPTSSK